MKRVFLLIALVTSISATAQKEYHTKGTKIMVQFDGVERVQSIERTVTIDWEITDSTMSRTDGYRGTVTCDITKKTKLKNGTMVYDITNGMWPMRLEITNQYVIFYDQWPNWDKKDVHPLIKK